MISSYRRQYHSKVQILFGGKMFKTLCFLCLILHAVGFKCYREEEQKGIYKRKEECKKMKHNNYYCEYEDDDDESDEYDGDKNCGSFEQYYIPFDYCFSTPPISNDCKCKCLEELCNESSNKTKCDGSHNVTFNSEHLGELTPLDDTTREDFFRYMEENFDGSFLNYALSPVDLYDGPISFINDDRIEGEPKKGF